MLLIARDGSGHPLKSCRRWLFEPAKREINRPVFRVDVPAQEVVALLRDEQKRGCVGYPGDPEPAVVVGHSLGSLRAITRLKHLGAKDRLPGRIDHSTAHRCMPADRRSLRSAILTAGESTHSDSPVSYPGASAAMRYW